MIRQHEKRCRRHNERRWKFLPFILGPSGVPYIVDSHHTICALDTLGYDGLKVTFEKICDWNNMDDKTFYINIVQYNFMDAIGRLNSDFNELPVIIDPSEEIPSAIAELKDNPCRGFGSLVR